MTLCYELSMPGVNSWNGKWSGEGRCHAIVRTYRGKAEAKAAGIAARGSYHYHFGDGWVARVDVRIVDAAEARRMRAKSKGFQSYDWMVDSIERHGEILNSLQEAEILKREREAVTT